MNRFIYTPMGNGIKVLYPLSNRHSYFEFSGNESPIILENARVALVIGEQSSVKMLPLSI